MSLYFESLKPISKECTIEKWREHAEEMRKLLDGKQEECRDLRNESRKLRYDTFVKKKWDFYLNNVKLSDRVYEIQMLITYAEAMLPKIANEKKLIQEEKFHTETLLQKCDTWIGVCMEGLNSLDRKLELELTRNDEGTEETKKEIKLLEDIKGELKNDCISAWETASKLEEVETKIALNLEFKREVLEIELDCQAIVKMDTGVSYKVDATEGPKKMLSIEEWSKAVYGLVELGETQILKSIKQREKMAATRGISLNEYAIQFDKTDYALRKRIFEINKEKNESQYQLMRVKDMMEVTHAELIRLEQFLADVKDDLKCAETRCSKRYFRPSIEATVDPPFTGMNNEVDDLLDRVAEIEAHIDELKSFNTKLEEDSHKLFLETESKNKALQIQIQALDIRIAGRYDPKKIYAYKPELLTSRMVKDLPEPFTIYSNQY